MSQVHPRIAHIGKYDPSSSNGVHRSFAGMVEHLAERGVDVEVWHFTHRASSPTHGSVNGITIHQLPFYRFGPRLEITKNLRWMPRQTRAWVRVQSQRVHVLHMHSVYQPANVWTARLVRVPYVITPHGGYNRAIMAGSRRWAKRLWFEMLERRLLNGAASIHLVSPREQEGLAALGIAAPVTCIPNGLDDALLSIEPQTVPRHGYWLFVGRLDVSIKGLDLLFQAYAAARRFTPEMPRLVLAGPDWRGGLARLEALAAQLQIDDRVTFTGPVYGQEKERLLLGASLVVLTSRTEGLPLSVLEAMAVGRPVLVTPGTNLCNEVASSDAGFAAGNDIESIAARLSAAALASDTDLNRMGSAAARLVRSHYRWSTAARQLAEMYRGIYCDAQAAKHNLEPAAGRDRG